MKKGRLFHRFTAMLACVSLSFTLSLLPYAAQCGERMQPSAQEQSAAAPPCHDEAQNASAPAEQPAPNTLPCCAQAFCAKCVSPATAANTRPALVQDFTALPVKSRSVRFMLPTSTYAVPERPPKAA